ncbi:hypothetical protein H5410_037655 [Solanum commersonii]|uniref:Uncharacterized protein n=1 Tax=Solanum commersonii TaxID=4109 RepID=A0A9J5Y925_SOLCO|nr:hypothetical protein H5410_037655 [Solanum commersonii]
MGLLDSMLSKANSTKKHQGLKRAFDNTGLTAIKTREMRDKMAMGAWGSSGDARDRTTSCIKEATRKLLRVSSGNFGGHRGDWRWNGAVQGKVETKKVANAKLVESKDEEEKWMTRESGTKDKGRNKKMYRLAKVRNLDQVECIKDKKGNGDLEHIESRRDFGYCKHIKVEEVKDVIHRMSKGRAIMPYEIPVEFWKITNRRVKVVRIRMRTGMSSFDDYFGSMSGRSTTCHSDSKEIGGNGPKAYRCTDGIHYDD